MANVKFTEFPSAATVGSTDIIPIVQGGLNKKATVTVFSTYLGSLFVNLTGTQTITGSKTFSSQLISNVATGTAPFSIASTTKVTNLNADLLDGYTSADFQLALTNPVTGTGTTNYLPKFTGTSALGDSILLQGTNNSLNNVFSSATGTQSFAGMFTGQGASGNTGVMFFGAGEPNGIDPSYPNIRAGLKVYQSWNGSATDVKFDLFTLQGGIGGNIVLTGLPNGNAYLPNSVGIGTTSPAALLDINGSSSVQQNFSIANDRYISIYADSSQSIINSVKSVPLIFRTNDTERMRITSGGLVGIGTTSPAYKLVVSNGGALGLEIDPSSNSGTQVEVLTYNRSAGAYKPLKFNSEDFGFITASTERLTIKNGGNVGIGTTSPSERLSVASTDEYLLSWQRTGDSKRWAFGADSSGTFISNRTDSVLPLFIKNSGNVLIGTITDAGYKLDVNGTARVSGNLTIGLGSATENVLIIDAATYSGIRLSRGGTQKWGIFNNNAGTNFFDIYNYNTASSVFSISPTGAATFSSTLNAKAGSYINGASNSDWGFSVENTGTTNANGLYVNIGSSSTGIPFRVDKGGSSLFNIANSGAAEFSSSVTATTAKFTAIPTSSAGLSAGDIWNDGGTLKIV